MIVKNLKKLANNKYNVTIDNDTYKFNENIVVKYRLVKGKEIDDKILKEALEANDYDSIYLKTEKYVINYRKSEKEVINYLRKKEIDEKYISKIIKKLKDNKLIDDSSLVDAMVYSLIKKSNGKKLIEQKLFMHGLDNELIDKAIKNIDMNEYYNYLSKLYEKIKHKYDKYDDYIRINKIKNYLLQKGYTFEDINTLRIK